MVYGDVRDEGARINAIKKRVGYVETLMHMSGQLEFIGYRMCELVDMLSEINGKLDKPNRAVVEHTGPPIAYAASEQIDDEEIVITSAGVAAGMARIAALRGR